MLAEPPARFRTQLRNSHTDRGGRQVRGVLAFNGGRPDGVPVHVVAGAQTLVRQFLGS